MGIILYYVSSGPRASWFDGSPGICTIKQFLMWAGPRRIWLIFFWQNRDQKGYDCLLLIYEGDKCQRSGEKKKKSKLLKLKDNVGT